MDETLFSLLFAVAGMTAVFVVIVFLTLAMVATGQLFARRGAGPAGSRQKAGTVDGVPGDHVAVIAAALSIHASGGGSEIALMGGTGSAPWTGPARQRPSSGEVPALRRTR